MITNFKIFEDNNIKPKLYDYVILNLPNYSFNFPEFHYFLNNNIGRIIEVKKIPSLHDDYRYTIFFDDPKFKEFLRKIDFSPVYLDDIKYFSPNKNKLKRLLAANKYNL